MKELKEEVKEIIENNLKLTLTSHNGPVIKAITDKGLDEITALINDNYYDKKFVEWLHDNTDDTRDPYNYEYWWLIPAEDYLPIDEIFQYWKTEINDK